MSQDIVADALNMIMNAKKAGKDETEIARCSKFLIEVLEVAKKNKYVDYKKDGGKVVVKISKLNNCRAIKPRYTVTAGEIEKYMRRYLPAINFGILILSTSSGLMTQKEAYEKNLGGSLIAYFY